jgi:hypothetical protein
MVPLNVHVALCTNGFNLFRSFVAPYYYWLAILTIYNLPSGMSMRSKFIFLFMVKLNLNNLDRTIDNCFILLIDELNQLWSFDIFLCMMS